MRSGSLGLDRGFTGQNDYNKLTKADIKLALPLTKNQKLHGLFTDYEPHITKHQPKGTTASHSPTTIPWTGQCYLVKLF
jgi:hypothetical protein